MKKVNKAKIPKLRKLIVKLITELIKVVDMELNKNMLHLDSTFEPFRDLTENSMNKWLVSDIFEFHALQTVHFLMETAHNLFTIFHKYEDCH